MTTLRLPENIEIITLEVVNNALVTQELSRQDITEIVISEGTTEIGPSAFTACESLSSIEIPESVTRIGPWAFRCCKNLKSIVLPKNLTEINTHLFALCTSLCSIVIPENVKLISSGAFYECESLTEVTIPEGVTEMEQGIFKGCIGLISIKILAKIVKIENNKFEGCTSLTTITIPDGIREIGKYAFKDCINLTTVIIPEGVNGPNGQAIRFSKNPSVITIPKIVRIIDEHAWENFYGNKVILVGSLIKIDDYAFSGCANLRTITIPVGVKDIGTSAFDGCSSLKLLVIPDVFEGKSNQYWAEKGLNPEKTTIISIGKLRSELDDSLNLTKRKIECNDTMLSLMYNLVKNICNVSQIKSSVINMNTYDFMRSLILINKTLITEIYTGSQALPSVSINWKKLVERDISINYKKFDEKKQTETDQSLNIPLKLFSEHLTVRDMQNLIVATELSKDKDEKSVEKEEDDVYRIGCCIV